jgi:coenzyme F420 hydrogenase subunit beta
MEENSFSELKSKVIDSDLCCLCGGCVASCPVDVLEFGQEGIELVGECISCGTCLRICPGSGVDFSTHEMRLFGRSRRSRFGKRLGFVLSKMNLKASDPRILRAGYFGGRVTSLIIYAMDKGLIDAAILTDWGSGRNISVGSARIARTRDDVVAMASVKSVFSPVLTLLGEVKKDPAIKEIAVVGLPCHIEAVRKMEIDPVAKQYTEKIRYLIGLNCGASILGDQRTRLIVADLMKVDPDSIVSYNYHKVRSRELMFHVDLVEGKHIERKIPLSEYFKKILGSEPWPRCGLCPDYSSELADLSFGGPVVRTEKGLSLISGAVRDGILMNGGYKRRAAQYLTDITVSSRKRRSTRRKIKKRITEGKIAPVYK